MKETSFTLTANDIYDGRGGTLTGHIRLGAGDDIFYGGNNNDKIYVGVGDDFIDGGAGEDMVLLNRIGLGGLTLDLAITTRQPEDN